MPDVPASLAEALAALQADLPHIRKAAEGQSGTRKIMYADLPAVAAAIYPKLAEYGLMFFAKPTLLMFGDECKFVLWYSLKHVASGDEQVGQYPITPGNPQQMGSAITYARRYTLVTVTGCTPDEDDDDGQAASELRALQRQAPETRDDGSATFAEQTRMVSGPVPGTTRSNGRDAEPFDTSDRTAEQVKESRMRQMFATYRELDITGNDPESKAWMLADLSGILARPIESRKDLNLSELTTVCAILRRRTEQEART